MELSSEFLGKPPYQNLKCPLSLTIISLISGESIIHHTIMEILQITTFNWTSSKVQWTLPTRDYHMSTQHAGQPLNQQVEGYVSQSISKLQILLANFPSGCHFWLGNNFIWWQTTKYIAEGMSHCNMIRIYFKKGWIIGKRWCYLKGHMQQFISLQGQHHKSDGLYGTFGWWNWHLPGG